MPDAGVNIPPEEVRDAYEHAPPGDRLLSGMIQQERRYLSVQLRDQHEALQNRGLAGKATPPKFSTAAAEDWHAFRRQFEQAALINGWHQVRAKRELVRAMEGKASTATLDLDSENGLQTFEVLMLAFEARFVHAAESQMARIAYHRAQQRYGENCHEWHTRLRGLHQRAFPLVINREVDPHLIHIFVFGLRHMTVKQRCADENPQTYGAALVAASNGESVQCMMNAGRGYGADKGGKAVHALQVADLEIGEEEEKAILNVFKKKPFPTNRGGGRTNSNGGKRDGRTNNNGGKGGNGTTNNGVQRTCFVCGSAAHLQANCPKIMQKQKKVNAITTADVSPAAAPSAGNENGSRPTRD